MGQLWFMAVHLVLSDAATQKRGKSDNDLKANIEKFYATYLQLIYVKLHPVFACRDNTAQRNQRRQGLHKWVFLTWGKLERALYVITSILLWGVTRGDARCLWFGLHSPEKQNVGKNRNAYQQTDPDVIWISLLVTWPSNITSVRLGSHPNR